MVDLLDQVAADDQAFYPGDGTGFDVAITWQGLVGRCQFTKDWADIDEGEQIVSSRAPQALIAKALFPALAFDDQVVIDGVTYVVRDIRDDDTDRLLILSNP